MKLTIELDEDLVQKANEVLEASYLDVSTVIGIVLRKIVTEQSFAFLFASKDKEQKGTKLNSFDSNDNKTDSKDDCGKPPILSDVEYSNSRQRDMTKSRATRLLLHEGHKLASNVTFASKNRGSYNYWANPEFLFLKSDWSLILNDWIERKLYLFTIPANSIRSSELNPRSDNKYLIDLQIMYKDPTFTDNRSGYSFIDFLTAETDY